MYSNIENIESISLLTAVVFEVLFKGHVKDFLSTANGHCAT